MFCPQTSLRLSNLFLLLILIANNGCELKQTNDHQSRNFAQSLADAAAIEEQIAWDNYQRRRQIAIQPTIDEINQIDLKSKEAIDALIRYLSHEDSLVQIEAQYKLASIGATAVPALIKELQIRSSSETRQAIAETLGKIGPNAKAATPALIDLLDEDREDLFVCVGRAAAEALEKIGPEAKKAAIPRLISLLKEGKRSAAIYLGNFGHEAKDAVPALIEALKDYHVRKETVEALGLIGPEANAAIPTLIEQFDYEEYAAPVALKKISPDGKDTVPLLIKTLNETESLTIRQASIFALELIGPDAKAAIPALIKLLPNEWFRLRPSEALVSIGKPAVPSLVEVLSKDKNNYNRRFVAYILGDIGPDAKTAIPTLTKLLKDKDVDVRKAAEEAIKKISPPKRFWFF